MPSRQVLAVARDISAAIAGEQSTHSDTLVDVVHVALSARQPPAGFLERRNQFEIELAAGLDQLEERVLTSRHAAYGEQAPVEDRKAAEKVGIDETQRAIYHKAMASGFGDVALAMSGISADQKASWDQLVSEGLAPFRGQELYIGYDVPPVIADAAQRSGIAAESLWGRLPAQTRYEWNEAGVRKYEYRAVSPMELDVAESQERDGPGMSAADS